MATTTNGNSNAATEGMSAAERLMQAHNVTIEDAVDEDLPVPAASSLDAASGAVSGSEPSSNGTGIKAAGKQPIRDAPAPAASANRPALDTQSEELFPSLGASRAPTTGSSMWSKKPAAIGKANGTATAGKPVNAASRSAAPSAGFQSGSGLVNLPGRNSESIVLPLSEMKPRKELKKPVADILRDINKRSKASVVMKPGTNGAFVFEGTGPIDAVRSALKEVAGELYAKVSRKHPWAQPCALIPFRNLKKYPCP